MSQTDRPHAIESTPAVPDRPDLASYEDGDATVICDRTEPAAWVRSTVSVALRR